MSREQFEDTAITRYDEILSEFVNLALNRFEWENLPTGLTTENLEQMLIERGQVFAYKRNNGSLTILPCMPTNKITVYGEFDEFEVIGMNGYREKVKADEGVRIKNNPVASDNMNNLRIYAKRIDDVEMTQDVNLFQQNIPKIVLTDENGKLTAKNIINQLKKFKLVIFGKKSLSAQFEQSDVLDTSAPYLLDKLQVHKKDIYNEVLTYLGINNANTEKRERLITDEVNANNDYIAINLDLMFDMRERAVKQINEMFNTNIIVRKREVEQVGTIHTDNKTNSGKQD